jgi:hypothetical protein
MNTFLSRLSLAAVVLLVAACSQVPVSTDYDPEWQLKPAATYAWLPPQKKLVTDPAVDNDLFARRMQRAVDEQMAAKGLAKSDVDSADLLVTYHVTQETRLDVDTFRANYGYYPCWGGCWGPGWGGGWGSDVYVREYTAGTLMVDVVDAKSRELRWRGISERRVPSFRTPQEREAFIRETVTAIFQNFPR